MEANPGNSEVLSLKKKVKMTKTSEPDLGEGEKVLCEVARIPLVYSRFHPHKPIMAISLAAWFSGTKSILNTHHFQVVILQ